MNSKIDTQSSVISPLKEKDPDELNTQEELFDTIKKLFYQGEIEYCQGLYFTNTTAVIEVLHGRVLEVAKSLKEKSGNKRITNYTQIVETEQLVTRFQTGEGIPGRRIAIVHKEHEPTIDEIMRECLDGASFSTISGYCRDGANTLYMLTVAHSHMKELDPPQNGMPNSSPFVYDLREANPPLSDTHLFLYEMRNSPGMFKKLSGKHISLHGTYNISKRGKTESVIADICAIKIPADIEQELQIAFIDPQNVSRTDMTVQQSVVETTPYGAQVFGATSGQKDMEIDVLDYHVYNVHSQTASGPYLKSYPGLHGGDSGASFISRFNDTTDVVDVYSIHGKSAFNASNQPFASYSYPINNQLDVLSLYELDLRLVPAP